MVPTVVRMPNSSGRTEASHAKPRNNAVAEKPPTSAMISWIWMNRVCTSFSTYLLRYEPRPIALRYTPMTKLHWVTESPSRYEAMVALISS